jgi:hypothetical protein
MAENVQVAIGFQASPPLNVRIPSDQLDGLLGAIGGEGWHDLDTVDGRVRLSLQHVLYVRTEREEHRVGFGIAG